MSVSSIIDDVGCEDTIDDLWDLISFGGSTGEKFAIGWTPLGRTTIVG